MARKHASGDSSERWLVSYADFITLLFAFFVVMFASSEVDRKKLAELAAAYRGAVGAVEPVDGVQALDLEGLDAEIRADDDASLGAVRREMGAVQSKVEDMLAELLEDEKVKIKLERRGLVISLTEAAFFPAGTAGFRREALDYLSAVGSAVASVDDRQIRLEGHTDDRPISSDRFPSNWELSSARAIAVLRFLVDETDIDESRISVAGYGEFRPAEPNATAEGRAANRRVDIVILSNAASAEEPE